MVKLGLTILSIGVLLAGVIGLETIVNDGQLVLTTTVEGRNLRVRATSATLGYIGWGISPSGTMAEADIVVAGYNATNGTGYAGDYYAVRNGLPTLDDSQDVTLVSASENATHTTVEFLRPLNSLDTNQDVPITSGVQNVIWSLGATDALDYHNSVRGLVQLDLLGGNASLSNSAQHTISILGRK